MKKNCYWLSVVSPQKSREGKLCR